MITTLIVQVKCFQEIISIGHQVFGIHGLPWFCSLYWYFLLTLNYFFYGENLVDYFHKSCGISQVSGKLALAGHEAVQFVFLDSCFAVDCSTSKLFHHTKHFWRSNLAYCSRLHDCMQWCHGLHIWLFLWQNTAYQAESKKSGKVLLAAVLPRFFLT